MLSATQRRRSPRCFPSSPNCPAVSQLASSMPATAQLWGRVGTQRSRAFGASLPYTGPSEPRSSAPVDVETPYHLISLPFPLIWGNALNSTIKLKVMCPDKSIKILFATPTDKSHPIQGLASCLNIWLILSRTHNNTRVLKSTHLREK